MGTLSQSQLFPNPTSIVSTQSISFQYLRKEICSDLYSTRSALFHLSLLRPAWLTIKCDKQKPIVTTLYDPFHVSSKHLYVWFLLYQQCP